MTTLALPGSETARASIFAQLTAVAATLLAMALLWALVDPRLIDGVPVWLKPAKFALSFVVHFGTLAVIVAALSPERQTRRLVTVAGGVMAVAFLGEMAYMIVQAAQAQHSHFNSSTPFHIAMYQLMGVGAVMLIGMPVIVAHVARGETSLGPATRAGIWWGALSSFVLTLIVAGYMSNGSGHFVGAPTDPARVLPFLGWSTEVGDLRPAHFLSIHALQALPLLGLWADRTGRSAAFIRPAALVWTALTLAVFGQALLGLPLVSI